MKKVLCLLLSLMLACAGSVLAFAEDAPVVIKYTGWLENNQAGLEAVAALYTAAHPNVTFEFEMMDTEQFDTVIMARLSTGESGDIIAARYQLADKQNYAAGNYLLDLSGLTDVRANLKEGMDMVGEYEGAIQGYPGSADVWGVWYNADMLKELGYDAFPNTWEGFKAVCQSAKDAGKLPIANGLQEGWTAWMLLWGGLFGDVGQSDPHFFDDCQAGTQTFSSNEKMVKALNRFKELNDLGYLPENVLGVSQDVACQEFFAGNALLCPSGSWYLGDINAAACPFEVSFAKLPYSDEPQDDFCAQGGYTFLMSVPTTSAHADVAKDFISFFFQPENYATYCNVAQVTGPTVRNVTVDFDPVANTIGAMITAMNTSLHPGVAQDELHAGIQAMLSGQMTAEQVLEEMDLANEKALDK